MACSRLLRPAPSSFLALAYATTYNSLYYLVKSGARAYLFLLRMILTCPSCNTRYMLDMASTRPEGQTVRCFKCKHTWVQDRPRVEEGPVASTDIPSYGGDKLIGLKKFERHSIDRKTGKPIVAKPKLQISGIVDWVLFFVVFGAAITSAAIVYRDTMRKIWPASNRLYTLIGDAAHEIRPISNRLYTLIDLDADKEDTMENETTEKSVPAEKQSGQEAIP